MTKIMSESHDMIGENKGERVCAALDLGTIEELSLKKKLEEKQGTSGRRDACSARRDESQRLQTTLARIDIESKPLRLLCEWREVDGPSQAESCRP